MNLKKLAIGGTIAIVLSIVLLSVGPLLLVLSTSMSAFGGGEKTTEIDLIDVIINHKSIPSYYQGEQYDTWLPSARDDTYEMKEATKEYFTSDSDASSDVKAQNKRKKAMALSTYYVWWLGERTTVAPEGFSIDYKKYAECFTGEDFSLDSYVAAEDNSFSNLENYFDIEISKSKKETIAYFAGIIINRMHSSNSKVTSVEDVDIDFDSFYYNFDPSGENGKGSLNVCHSSNRIGWPYGAKGYYNENNASNCEATYNGGQSITGAWNKMICASYASSRAWEVWAPEDDYPLPSNWNHSIDNQTNPDSSKFDLWLVLDEVPEWSILEIKYTGGGGHVAFLEAITDEGYIISECNATPSNEYGFRCGIYNSLQEWVGSYGNAYFHSALSWKGI